VKIIQQVALSPPLFIRSKCLIFHAPLSRVVYFLMRTSPYVRVHFGVIPQNDARPHEKPLTTQTKQPPRGWTSVGVRGRGADVPLRVYLAANTLLLSSLNVMDIIGHTMRSPNQLLHVYKCKPIRLNRVKFIGRGIKNLNRP